MNISSTETKDRLPVTSAAEVALTLRCRERFLSEGSWQQRFTIIS